MPERRLIRATKRALPLLLDIIDSTSYLYAAIMSAEEHAAMEITEKDLAAGLNRGEYLIGFEDHFPFGFIGAEKVEDCCRFIGPYLYRDYLGKGHGKFLLDVGGRFARRNEFNLIYQLIHRQAHWAISFFSYWGFEAIADNPESIKRWRDGLLADQPLPVNHRLFARLLENLPG